MAKKSGNILKDAIYITEKIKKMYCLHGQQPKRLMIVFNEEKDGQAGKSFWS